jgi:hypothetical protein
MHNPHYKKNKASDRYCPRCNGKIVRELRRCEKCKGWIVYPDDLTLIATLSHNKDAFYVWSNGGWVYQEYWANGHNYTDLRNE